MKKLYIVQWGKERSILKEVYPDTLEVTHFIVDNDYLMMLDEMGLIA